MVYRMVIERHRNTTGDSDHTPEWTRQFDVVSNGDDRPPPFDANVSFPSSRISLCHGPGLQAVVRGYRMYKPAPGSSVSISQHIQHNQFKISCSPKACSFVVSHALEKHLNPPNLLTVFLFSSGTVMHDTVSTHEYNFLLFAIHVM